MDPALNYSLLVPAPSKQTAKKNQVITPKYAVRLIVLMVTMNTTSLLKPVQDKFMTLK